MRGKWCRLVWWCDKQEINEELLLQAQRKWRSTQLGLNKQATVAIPSSEAEQQDLAASISRSTFSKHPLEDFGIQQKYPISTGEDNQTCIRICQNPVIQRRSKHIDKKFHIIQNTLEHGNFSIHYVPTEKMAGLTFKKSLPVSKMETFRKILKVVDPTRSAQVWVGFLNSIQIIVLN